MATKAPSCCSAENCSVRRGVAAAAPGGPRLAARAGLPPDIAGAVRPHLLAAERPHRDQQRAVQGPAGPAVDHRSAAGEARPVELSLFPAVWPDVRLARYAGHRDGTGLAAVRLYQRLLGERRQRTCLSLRLAPDRQDSGRGRRDAVPCRHRLRAAALGDQRGHHPGLRRRARHHDAGGVVVRPADPSAGDRGRGDLHHRLADRVASDISDPAGAHPGARDLRRPATPACRADRHARGRDRRHRGNRAAALGGTLRRRRRS